MILKVFGILLVLVISFSGLFAQSINDIRKQKEKTEKEITYLNKLLSDAAKDKTVSTEKLNILQEKIVQSKKLLSSLNQEVQYLQSNISKNEQRIAELQGERKSMLDLYAKLVYGTWKKRNKTNKLMFIFSSSDFNQAYNRYKYFQQIQEYSSRQLQLIHQVNDSLNLKNQDLKSLINQKNTVVSTINSKNHELESEKIKESQYVTELQKKEKELKRKLDKEMQNRQKLAKELSKLMARQAKKSSGSATATRLTPEEKLISDDFAKNKGKLPWPVAEGFISEKFGIKPHNLHRKVSIENDGIDITTTKDSDVRSIFKGVVVDIVLMPGLYNVVLIQHGDYYTVYPNLVKLLVKRGDKVNTKDVIGKIGYDSEKGSVLNFQIWKNSGKVGFDKLNPELWLAK